MELTLDRPNLISLAAGFTDQESLPVREAREVLAELLGSAVSGRPALQYGTTRGDPRLRALTAERVRQLDAAGGEPGVYSPHRVLITSGSQQLLYMVTEALCDPGDVVLVENPTYFVFLGIMQSHGLRGLGVAMEEDGLDLADLERALDRLRKRGGLRRLKMLYMVSYFQNPTGVTTGFEKKRAALELLRAHERAAGHPLYLVEDAAYRELRFAGEDEKSALAAGRLAERVIHTGTFSKPFATGARVGFGFLPGPVFSAVERIKGNHDFGTSNLLQQLLAGALLSGRFDAHLESLRRRYARKAKTMTTALRGHFPAEAAWREPRGGLYVWARAPRFIRTGVGSTLFRRALRNDVLYVPGGLCYAPDRSRAAPDCEMRLSFGGASLADIREGVARLGKTLRGILR